MKRPQHILFMLRPPEEIRADDLILISLFLVGIALGHVCGGLVQDQQHKELADYVVSYARSVSNPHVAPIAGTVISYFRVPAALFILGLAVCGTWLVPIVLLGHGFLLAFSVHCFGISLGRQGVLLAFTAFGIRCLFVLPCVFYLAVRSWNHSKHLREGRPLRDRSVSGFREFYPLFSCGIILLIGCIIDISLVPRLMTLVLSQIS